MRDTYSWFCHVIIIISFFWYVLTVLSVHQEASPSHVASAGTLAVAFMETLSTVLLSFSNDYK